MEVTIVIPTGEIFAGPAEGVVAPGSGGEFGILPGHTPFLSTLQAGTVVVRQGRDEQRFPITGGFAEVRGDRVVILADGVAETAD
ncbi:MAG: ATP synthase F1 subunit epsilon [Nitrospirae bacterium CG18_big_fil_WC_8_21_14_2_50_70_55]|nr:ATP synthase F1 subunit epsilon [Deltaproteobacteria bacterium]OIP63338.1 MAG: ATP synthase F1 subunit epsilon [Nitrospirae bacterium CG2_30_70_394]PIQ05076.1 MAG: ATP synthase F1 subunit epsilon [Nitrospirae bacterium CG18_big_fil_WC_8_21_14_2_50_70_55]PIU78983.1 MAG: ATP synthase F1 subunit epsilon [Nitrospirae bacterium CG06_land_8_20_14_3_00_70_43]PIW83021.1 MAG: ATP synthase F1 subunit epsilon [Nitrospirae bacterium CG_4_8_14_3_um_filter_70_85]PIX83335.1 MAG: ATP synthase F1 subunit ep